MNNHPRTAGQALDLVNLARACRGLDPLERFHLAGAVPADGERCLLARAIDCDIVWLDPEDADLVELHRAQPDETEWWMKFATEREAYAVSEALDERYHGFREVALPQPLFELMRRFDSEELETGDLDPAVSVHQLSLADSPISQAEVITAEHELPDEMLGNRVSIP